MTRRKLEGGNLWGQLFNPQATNPSSAAIRLRCILERHLKRGVTRLAAGLTCQLQPCPAAQRAAHQLPQILRGAVPPKPAHQPVGLVLRTTKRGEVQASRRARFLMWLYRRHSHSSSSHCAGALPAGSDAMPRSGGPARLNQPRPLTCTRMTWSSGPNRSSAMRAK